MGSSSGTSSASSPMQNSGPDENVPELMDERKRKRMISNRESARRSRMRKQKHLDELLAQVTQLRKENQEIVTKANVTTQQYLVVEASNSVLRAQASELRHRLQSLNEIIDFLNARNGVFGDSSFFNEPPADSFFNHFDMALSEPSYIGL